MGARELRCFPTRRNWALVTMAGNAFSTRTGSAWSLAFTPQSIVPVYASLVRIRCESTWEAARREAVSLLLSRRPARVEAAGRLGQPCRRQVESVGTTDALRPTVYAAQGAPSQVSSGRSDQLNRKTGAQRVKDQRQLHPPDVDRGRRTRVNSVDSARAACEGPTSNSAVAAFPRGRF